MDIANLQAFIVVAETGSFSAASEQLFLTQPAVSKRIAALEGGSAAVCTSSGMAATFCAITAILGQGDHIVASSQMYGGNISLMKNTLPRFGITASFFDPTDTDACRAA